MKHSIESYLDDLQARLQLLTESQRAEIISEYGGHIAAEVTAGATESEVLRKFGKPAKVAHQFYATYGVYERFRKWQYAALAFAVIYLLALNEFAFGNPVATLHGSVPVSHTFWCLSLTVIGPGSYWIMCNRCRGQKVMPLIIAWLVFTPVFCYTTVKMPQFAYESTPREFALLPRTSAEVQELATASAPLGKIVKLANRMTTPELFAKQLSELQPAILKQSKYFFIRREEPGAFIIPTKIRTSGPRERRNLEQTGIQFGFTNGPNTALAAWKSFSGSAENLSSSIQPTTVEYSTGLRKFTAGAVPSKWTTWSTSASYFIFVAGVGIVFTYLRFPLHRIGKTRATA